MLSHNFARVIPKGKSPLTAVRAVMLRGPLLMTEENAHMIHQTSLLNVEYNEQEIHSPPIGAYVKYCVHLVAGM